MPEPKLTTMKVYTETLKLLRKISAESGKRMVWVIHNLAKAEADKLDIK